MRYYKFVDQETKTITNIATCDGAGFGNITEAEYNNILHLLLEAPKAPDGYIYILKEDLSWKLVEDPMIMPNDESDAEATIADYEEETITYDELLEALAQAEYELCLWELGIHDDLREEENA